jgi:hypothetical protein
VLIGTVGLAGESLLGIGTPIAPIPSQVHCRRRPARPDLRCRRLSRLVATEAQECSGGVTFALANELRTRPSAGFFLWFDVRKWPAAPTLLPKSNLAPGAYDKVQVRVFPNHLTHEHRRATMSAPSSRDTVIGGIVAVASMSFLIGMFFILGVQKLVQHDSMSILFLLALPLSIYAAVLNVRRILRVVP